MNISQNTANTFFPSEKQGMDDYSLDKVGGMRQPHHEYDQHHGPSQGQGHHDRSVDMSEWSESNSYHGPDQPSREKGAVIDRDKFKRMSKGNTDSMLPPPAQQSGDSGPKIHKKKKRKHKHGRSNRNEGEGMHIIDRKTNQAHTSLTEAPDLSYAGVKKSDDYTASCIHKSSLTDNKYNGEVKLKSVTAMSKPLTGKFDKDALANFIKEAKITQRKCTSYAPSGTGDDCQCGCDKKWHPATKLEKWDMKIEKWDMKTHTQKFDCNSFGEIKFEGFGNETANSQYICVDPETKHELLWTIMTEHWKLPIPQLLISITGGAKRFEPTQKHQQIFKRVLMNAATTTGAWIITGGMATGVMKIVGEAVMDHILTKGTSDKKIVALGIATWGCVANRESLAGDDRGLWPATYRSADLGNRKETGDEPEVPLDHNHTHFILVDDGSINKYGVEIELVAELEKFISNKKINTGLAEKLRVDLPVVKIVVEGGVNTMKTVWKSVAADIPVLVLQGSGRAADFISYGYQLSRDINILPKDFYAKLKKKAENIFQWEEKDSKEQIEECVQELKDILAKERLINVFNLNEADTKDIDRAILYALMKAKKSNSEAQLALALAWNRSDIAREKIITPSNRKWWKEKEHFLYQAMFTALVQDKVDFIQLFLDCGVSFSRFLTIHTLWNLYKCSLLDYSDSSAQMLRNLMIYIQQSWTAYIFHKQPEKFHPKPDLLNSVGKIMVHLLGDESMNLYSDNKFTVDSRKSEQRWFPGNHEEAKKAEGNQQHSQAHHASEDTSKLNNNKSSTHDFEHPEKELFLWAILFNRQEMAKMLWKMSENQIAGALVACALLKGLAAKAADEEELELNANLQEHSQKYEDFATDVLGECYSKNSQLARQLVVRRITIYGDTTLFTLAEASDLMKFMGHTCCQTKLNLIWKGRMAQYTQSWLILISIIFPFLIPLIKFTCNQASLELQDKSDTHMEGDELQTQRKEKVARNQVKPKMDGFTVQHWEAEASVRSKVFRNKWTQEQPDKLTMLTDPSKSTVGLISAIYCFYTAPITVFLINNISYLIFLAIFTYFVLTDLYPSKPSVLEYITWGWTVTMLIEEFRQVVAGDQHSIKFKIRSWFSSIWNRFDLVMYMLLLVSVITRYVLSEDQFTWARIIYSITLAVYYIRFMQAFFVEKNIGPKVIMIKNMIVDLMFFVLIFLIFVLSFGVAYQANLFPNSEPSWYLLKSIVYMPYWQMYGELSLDEMAGKSVDDCVKNETIWRAAGGRGRCPADTVLVPILGAIYVVLTNILLINLLIAMFSYTFQQVQEQSENVWRFYRFSLVQEYYDRPFLCPPFIIFNHLFRLVKYVCHKCGYDISKSYNEFKLELSDEDNDRLTLFEKSALEEYLSLSQRLELETVDRKVTTTHERLERVIDDLDNIRESVKPLKDLARWKEKVIEDLDNIKESVKPLENLAKWMDSAVVFSPPLSSRKVITNITDDTGEEMQICLNELGNQVAQNSHHINQMMQMLQQILRNQEQNMRTSHLEINDISPSTDA